MKDKLLINNRRYIGSKTSLLKYISDAIEEHIDKKDYTLADVFSGTGVVANFFSDNKHITYVNDNLYSNYVAYQAWLGKGKYSERKINTYINKFNKLDARKIKDNYFSNKFANKYYHINDARKIGYIREQLEKDRKKLSEREYFILLTSLLYETDRIANTCGHFESFLNKKPTEKGVILKSLEINDKHAKCNIYCKDANELVREIRADVFYIDPPYNARQYVNFYHLLENLSRWEKPEELEGNSMKFKRNHLKSEYSRAKAPIVFKDLIDNIDGKLIVVSYNNTYSAKSTASNNRITEKELLSILREKGKTTRKEINYKSFNAGKTDFNNHKEYLYICEVGK